MLFHNPNGAPADSKRRTSVLITAAAIALATVAAVAIIGNRQSTTGATQAASISAVTVLAISPLLTMLSNWLLGPAKESGPETQNDSEKTD